MSPQLPHQIEFIYQRILSFVAGVLSLLRKRLHRHQLLIKQSLSHVDRGKRALTDLPLRLEQLMKSSLVYFLLQCCPPCLYNRNIAIVESLALKGR